MQQDIYEIKFTGLYGVRRCSVIKDVSMEKADSFFRIIKLCQEGTGYLYTGD